MPTTRNGETLLDVGCGSGAFSIGASLRGYRSLGMSWDERNQKVAKQRASLCKANQASVEIFDVRNLDKRSDLANNFDIVVCVENIEHIMDDAKLMRDISACLKPGGFLLLTAPFNFYRPLSKHDIGPFSRIEDGGHVRRGYTAVMLKELCDQAGLCVDRVESCSGFLSQKITWLQRWVADSFGTVAGWASILPVRPLPIIFDVLIRRLFRWPDYSICLVAYKPRFHSSVKRVL